MHPPNYTQQTLYSLTFLTFFGQMYNVPTATPVKLYKLNLPRLGPVQAPHPAPPPAGMPQAACYQQCWGQMRVAGPGQVWSRLFEINIYSTLCNAPVVHPVALPYLIHAEPYYCSP